VAERPWNELVTVPHRTAAQHAHHEDPAAVLFWRDRNLRFHAYDLTPPTAHIDDLLTEIERA
jgi:hypothetical protein